MRDAVSVPSRCCVPITALAPFAIGTFAVTWGIIGFYILFPNQATAWFGAMSGRHPAFFLATWAPAIAAFAIVLFYCGWQGVWRFLSRVTLWRCSIWWAAFLLVGVPLVFAAGALVKGSLFVNPIFAADPSAILAAMTVMLFLGPIEEFGWRGVAQPLLQRHLAPIWAGLLIGVTWGLWHLPAFYLSGTVQSGWAFTPFFIGNVSLAVIVTPLFNASRGSIQLPAAFHYQLINPLWPDAQPYDTYLFVAVAIAVVWLNRTTLFKRVGAATDVAPSR